MQTDGTEDLQDSIERTVEDFKKEAVNTHDIPDGDPYKGNSVVTFLIMIAAMAAVIYIILTFMPEHTR